MLNLNLVKRWRMPVFAALAFCAMLVRLWTVGDLVTRLPSYGDVLENVWMFETAANSLFVQGQLPVFFPNVFYPQGWYAPGWTNGFATYLIGAPLAWLVSPAFAYNVLTLGAFAVSYVGCLIWLRKHFNGWLTVTLAVFATFANIHWFHVHGHIQFVWMLAWMPWLLHSLEQLYQLADARAVGPSTQHEVRRWRWAALRAGLFWSAMIHATPYGLFFGAAVAAPFLVVWLYQRTTRWQAVAVPAVAALVSLPYLVLFYVGLTYNGSVSYGLEHAQGWSASLNALFAPSQQHTVDWVRTLAKHIYSGPHSEASLVNLGVSGSVLGVIGGWLVSRQRGLPRMYLAIVGIGACLALGMVLTWNGSVMQYETFHYLDNVLWQVGRRIRPAAFNTVLAPGVFANGVPLPGYFIHMVLPYTESARVWARYVNVMLLGLTPLIGMVLARIPRVPQVLLSLLIIFELLPYPTGSVPLPTVPHPVYEWLVRQPRGAVLDVRVEGFVLVGGEIIYAQRFHHQPMINGLGSYLPPKVLNLQTYLLAHAGGMADPEFPRQAYALGTRYILLHLQDATHTADAFRANPMLMDVECFAPLTGTLYLNHPICAAALRP